MAGAKKSNKMRKVARNALYCKFYRSTNRREKNKVIRLKKRIANHPNDLVAKIALEKAHSLIRGF